MNWTAFLVVSVLVAGCAATATPPPSLPANLRVETPSSSVPPAIAAYSGTWSGNWGNQNQLSSTLVVEKIEGNTANLIYSWGTAPSWGINQPGFIRTLGTFQGNTLKTKVANGADITYEMVQDKQTLNGQYVLSGNTTVGTFKKQP